MAKVANFLLSSLLFTIGFSVICTVAFFGLDYIRGSGTTLNEVWWLYLLIVGYSIYQAYKLEIKKEIPDQFA